IRKAYDDGIISKGFIALKDVEIAAERDRDTAMESLRTWVTSRMPADIHNYISWFAEFNQQEYTAPPPVAPKSKAEAKKKTERAKNKEAKKTRKKNRG
ncbi:MAG: hypothetical protein JZU50_00950, partial [Desulfobulbaceae bacterium]|nr:hypothetical protein [Desulfobulbaceae bacterium]